MNRLYDAYTERFGLLNDRANRLAFSDDSSYYLLCSLEILDENGKVERKSDFFTKCTIKQRRSVAHVDTAADALTVSIGERARVDLGFMASLTRNGNPKNDADAIPRIVNDLRDVIYKDPASGPFDYESGGDHWAQGWQTAEEYLFGNVRQKLRQAKESARRFPEFWRNAEALEKVQPKNLDASEIKVRLGTTWIDRSVFQRFMYETFDTPFYLRDNNDVFPYQRNNVIRIEFSPHTAEWRIRSKNAAGLYDIASRTTYGTDRASAYRLLEDSLNLRDTRIYDVIEDGNGNQKRVLNAKETTLAGQKQHLIREAFKNWVWQDPVRRQALVKQYNEEMNCIRPREYDGNHLVFFRHESGNHATGTSEKRRRPYHLRRQYAFGTRSRKRHF